MSEIMLAMETKKIAEMIRPARAEFRTVREVAKEIVRKLKRATACEVALAGSIAKGTFLSGEGDIDVFVLFRKKMEKEKMKRLLEIAFRKAFRGAPYQMNYAEHPYIRFHYKGKRVDVVPAYKMGAGQRVLTAVDRSVLHTRFVLKNLGKRQKDEVRLLKKFLKAAELYGAEIKTEGFSGYLCELLIIRYRSFLNLMRAAAKWQFPMVIDLKRHYKKSDYPILFKKFGKSLVVIDPTDRERNVAAPLSEGNLRRFVLLARRFIKNPSERYFFRHTGFEEKLRKLRKKGFVAIVTFPKPGVVEDVLWGQIKKLAKALRKELADYLVNDIVVDAEREVAMAIGAKKNKAGGRVEVKGPPLEMKEHAARFKKTHKKSRFIVKGDVIFAIEKKPEKGLSAAIREVLKENEFRLRHLPLRTAKIRPD